MERKDIEDFDLRDEMLTCADLADANPCGMTPESKRNMARTVHFVLETMKFFNFNNTAQFLNVDQRTVRRFVESGKLPKPKRGGDKILSFSTHEVLKLARKREDDEHHHTRKKGQTKSLS